jgi:hypothetical protein
MRDIPSATAGPSCPHSGRFTRNCDSAAKPYPTDAPLDLSNYYRHLLLNFENKWPSSPTHADSTIETGGVDGGNP